jgi:hypothetical protein
MKIKAMSLLFFSVLLVLLSTTAEAGNTKWSMNASSCVLDSRYAANAIVDSQTGAVKFATGATGWILMSCPVSVFTYDAGCGMYLGLTGAGNDSFHPGNSGYPAGAHVGVGLNHSSYHNGVSSAIVSRFSNYAVSYISELTTHAFNFESNYYWISVNMYRANTTFDPVCTWIASRAEVPDLPTVA